MKLAVIFYLAVALTFYVPSTNCNPTFEELMGFATAQISLGGGVTDGDKCDSDAGVYGNQRENRFDELFDDCNAVVKKIEISHGYYVNIVKLTYRLSNGQDIEGSQHGTKFAKRTTIEIDVDAGERLVAVSGAAGRWFLHKLEFITSFGKRYGPYGGGSQGNVHFDIHGCVVGGIFGSSGVYMNSIGFYCRAAVVNEAPQ